MGNLGSIVLFKTELPTLNLFSDDLRKRFCELGYDIIDFDLSDGLNSMSKIYSKLQSEPIKAMIGFNSTLFTLKTPSGVNVWETLGIPTINILVDHPYWYHSILAETPANGIVLCIDQNHMKYINRFYPNIAISGFIPHGGSKVQTQVSPRPLDIVYTGSLFTEYINDRVSDNKAFDFDASKICHETIDMLTSSYNLTVEEAIEKSLLDSKISLHDETLRLFISSNVYIERVVGSYYREKILSSFAKSGLPLTIYGNGWGDCDWITLPNVCYKGYVSPTEAMKAITRSKFTLNSMPWFKAGAHERIFNSMLNGSVCVTETNPYIREILSCDSYIGFELNDASINTAINDVQNMLNHPEKLQSFSEKAYELSSEKHTWSNRADELHIDLLTSL